VYVPVHRTPAPWAAEAVAVIPLTTDHGGLSIGTYLISQGGSHVLQDRKASVSAPPTGSSTNGSISTDPGEPQTAPVYRITGASAAFGAAVAAGFAGTVAAAFGSAAGAGTTVAAG
jgi:hypothetical protein